MYSKYRIINTDTISFLEERVEHYAQLGWIPQGGICVSYQNGHIRFYQALIKTINL